MTVQMAPTGAMSSGWAYSPARDLLHLMAPILEAVFQKSYDDPSVLGPLSSLVGDYSEFRPQLQQAALAFWKAMELASGAGSGKRMDLLLEEAGWEACSPLARVALMHQIGTVTSVSFLMFTRELPKTNPTLSNSVSAVREALKAGLGVSDAFHVEVPSCDPNHTALPPEMT